MESPQTCSRISGEHPRDLRRELLPPVPEARGTKENQLKAQGLPVSQPLRAPHCIGPPTAVRGRQWVGWARGSVGERQFPLRKTN